MISTPMLMLRPAGAILRTCIGRAALVPEQRTCMSSSTIVRQSRNFASTTQKLANHTKVSLALEQAKGKAMRFSSNSSSSSSIGILSSRTLLVAGAATTSIFGPLILSRSAATSAPTSIMAIPIPFASTRVAYCAPATSPSGVRYDPTDKEPLINSKELSFGMAMGLCSGYLFKKLGKMMMLVVGLGFVWLQLLSSSGYVSINWTKVERRFKDQFDVDRDGKVTMNDARHGFRWLMDLLTRNFQFKSTYVGGFVLGFRYG